MGLLRFARNDGILEFLAVKYPLTPKKQIQTNKPRNSRIPR